MSTSPIIISVIVPVYNTEQYLPECLDSIINQRYKNLEIICIDDGSTDNSRHILDSYAVKDKRIKIIHQENKGVSAARNAGLDIATGGYISFVDSDDWLADDLYASLIREDNSGADVVQFGYQTAGKSKTKSINFSYHNQTNIKDILTSVNKCYTWNKLWKRELLNANNIRFPEEINFCEDVLFTVQVAVYSKMWHSSNANGYFYRYLDSSLSNAKAKQERRKADKYKIANRIIELGKRMSLSQEEQSALQSFAVKQLISVEDLNKKESRLKYKNLFGDNKDFIKKCRKAIKRQIFNISIKKHEIIIFGKNFWHPKPETA